MLGDLQVERAGRQKLLHAVDAQRDRSDGKDANEPSRSARTPTQVEADKDWRSVKARLPETFLGADLRRPERSSASRAQFVRRCAHVALRQHQSGSRLRGRTPSRRPRGSRSGRQLTLKRQRLRGGLRSLGRCITEARLRALPETFAGAPGLPSPPSGPARGEGTPARIQGVGGRDIKRRASRFVRA